MDAVCFGFTALQGFDVYIEVVMVYGQEINRLSVFLLLQVDRLIFCCKKKQQQQAWSVESTD